MNQKGYILRICLPFLMIFCSCDAVESSSGVEHHSSVAKPAEKVEVSLRSSNQIALQEVSQTQLEEAVASVLQRTLTEREQERLLPILQIMQSSCHLLWEKQGTLAQGLVFPTCLELSNDGAMVHRLSSELANGKKTEEMMSDFALTGPYFKERDQGTTIEIWLSSDKPILPVVIQRVLTLSAPQFQFYLFGQKPHPILGSSFQLNLSTENRQKLSKWLADGAELSQFVEIIEERSSSLTSFTENGEKVKSLGVRSTPTWFVQGYRLRGLQSTRQIERFYQYP